MDHKHLKVTYEWRPKATVALAPVISVPLQDGSTEECGAGSLNPDAQIAAATSSSVVACQPVVSGSCNTGNWCKFDVVVHRVEWSRLIPSLYKVWLSDDTADNLPLPVEEGCSVMLVDTVEGVNEGIEVLRHSLQDPVVAIDLEWKPEQRSGDLHDVAMMQLATAKFCLLIRVCKIGLDPPPKLLEFLRDPSVVVVGHGWGSADEEKLGYTWGIGKSDFAQFFDNQLVAKQLGFTKLGLKNMALELLGLKLTKAMSNTMTNWENDILSAYALQYAALDALVCGHIFRALRQLHADRQANLITV